MNEDDIAEEMINAWNEPFSTEHDPRALLVSGAMEIRRLRKECAARGAVIRALHEASTEMAEELRRRRPDPNAPLYLLSLMLIAAVMGVAWAFFGFR